MAIVSNKKSRKGTVSKGGNSQGTTVSEEELRRRIAEKAYELHQKRGGEPGRDIEDWLEAERLVMAEVDSQKGEKSAAPGRRRAPSKKETAIE
ncbi:MAG: DUF2934 domain-containing protein [Deltaproteobacteria bacterium]|nr:DUF2934 domain-containing protein [Deltaproteobacteria bacterium]